MTISPMERKTPMLNWQYLLLILAGVLVLLAMLHASIVKARVRRQRDFTRSLETLLQPKETIKVICPQKGFRCILTNNRIIFEIKGSFTAFPIKSVTKVQGTNEKGNRTTVPAKMVTMTVKIDKDYTLKNTGAEFCELAGQLSDRIKRQKQRQKVKDAGKNKQKILIAQNRKS